MKEAVKGKRSAEKSAKPKDRGDAAAAVSAKGPDKAATVEAGDNSKRALADALNVLLADAYALYFKTKNFHWHVRGPHFRDYHLLLDDQAAQVLAVTDPIAERVRKLGFSTLRSIGHIGQLQTIADNEALTVAPEAMLDELRTDTIGFIASLKAAKELCEQAGDNATDGLIDDWTDQAEERAWFLAETLSRAA